MKIEKFLKIDSRIRLPDKKPESTLYAELVERKYLVFDTGTPYIRGDGYYQILTRDDAVCLITECIDESDRGKISASLPKLTLEKLSRDSRLQVDIKGAFWENQYLINVRNGIYDIKKHQLIDVRDKKPIFDYVLDFRYSPNCRMEMAPTYVKFLETSLGEEFHEVLMRTTAYCLSSLTKGRLAFEILGPGRRGKSCWLEFMSSVVPEEHRSNISFSDLGKQEYLIKLRGKRINICSDNDPAPMKNESLFKRIVSCEEVMARDLYQSAVSFAPTAKLIFASNHDLEFAHPDDELLDRLLVIPFGKEIPEEKRDLNLVSKLIAEKDVIMSMAVDTLKDLVDTNYDFKEPESCKEYIKWKRYELRPDIGFLSTQVEIDPNGKISSKKLWDEFNTWCSDNALKPLGQKQFLGKVCEFHSGITKAMIGPANRRINGFKGLRYKNANDFEDKEKEV